jgi:pectin methylesterase-like acyl-CoA thioesterase
MANGTNCTAFVTDSYLEGDTDFMWGQASVYFQRCELKAVNPGFYVQARNPQTSKGFVYVDCKLTGTAAAAGTFLARADPTPGNFPYSQVVYINCAMDTHIPAAGWKLDNATTSSTVQFWEYKSTDLNGALLDVSSRLSSSKQIDAATAVQYRDPRRWMCSPMSR